MKDSIDAGIEGLKAKLTSNPNRAWQYNAEEDRYYSYQELKDRREEIKYPDQMGFERVKIDPEILYTFKKEVLDNPNTYKLDYDRPQDWIPEVFPEGPDGHRVMFGEQIDSEETMKLPSQEEEGEDEDEDEDADEQ